ncbi:MAG: YggS family pyridoxal phosphate-dependent enzyme [Bacillota bacterium]
MADCWAEIAVNLARVREKIRTAALRAGRRPEEITLVAVSKTVPPEGIQAALAAGVTDLGENRVQELLAKQPELPPGLRWHLIGTLQTNKVKYIIDRIHLLHSLDRWELAREISKRASARGLVLKALIQVNVSGEETKHGLAPGDVPVFYREVQELPGLQIEGLMTMAPFVVDAEQARPYFRQLRELARELGLKHLSMGMSNDYQVAIEEGATLVRIGSDIFGARR